MHDPVALFAAWSVALVGLAIAAVKDLADRSIPNQTVVLVGGGGLLARLTASHGSTWVSLATAAVVFLALSAMYANRLIGGGDAKLITASTLVVPADGVLSLLVEIAVAGGVLAILYLAAGALLRTRAGCANFQYKPAQSSYDRERERILVGNSLPYGLAVFGGVVAHLAVEVVRCSSADFC